MKNKIYIIFLFIPYFAYGELCTHAQIIFTKYVYPKYLLSYESYNPDINKLSVGDDLLCKLDLPTDEEIRRLRDSNQLLTGSSYRQQYYEKYYEQQETDQFENNKPVLSHTPQKQAVSSYDYDHKTTTQHISPIEPLRETAPSNTDITQSKESKSVTISLVANISTNIYLIAAIMVLLGYIVFKQLKYQKKEATVVCKDCGNINKQERKQCFACGSYL